MENEALGAYLRTLRVARRLTTRELRDSLSDYVSASDGTRLWRVEQGEVWPRGDFLVALLEVLHGRQKDIVWLMRHRDATAADGERLARQLLDEEADAQRLLLAASRSVTEEEMIRILQLALDIPADDRQRWLRLGERLRQQYAADLLRM